MDIFAAGSRPTQRAPKDYFTGTVWQDPIVAAPAPARLAATRVAFEPGARTAWHTHPLGQTLYVVTGVGRIQTEGGPVREIRAGDVVWIHRTAQNARRRGANLGILISIKRAVPKPGMVQSPARRRKD